jgi:5'-nucleotidase
VLVTNDDGIESPGLHSLAAAALGLHADITVVAPADDQSGSGTAVGPLRDPGPLTFEPTVIPGVPVLPAYCVRFPPALAVLSACLGDHGARPDLVLSGVNAGSNLGNAVLHSGTVGAALTAANLNVPAVAVSLDLDGGRARWDTAAEVAVAAARWLRVVGLPVALNVNVPNVHVARLQGVRMAPLSRLGSVRAACAPGEGAEPPQDLELQLPDEASGRDTDARLLELGYVTISGLRPLGGTDLRVYGVASFMEEALAIGDAAPSRLAVPT